MTLLVFQPCDINLDDNIYQGGGKWDKYWADRITYQSNHIGEAALRLQNRSRSVIGRNISAATTLYMGWFASTNQASTPYESEGFACFWSDAAETNPLVEIRVPGSSEVDGRIGFYNYANATNYWSSSGVYPLPEKWHHIEVELVVGASGSVHIKVDGQTALNQTAIDTRGTGAASSVGRAAFGAQRGLDTNVRNLEIHDDAGAAPFNDFIGPTVQTSLVPTGAGNYAQFTPSTGSNWQNVDEVPSDGDTTYNEETATSQRDSFTFDDLPAGHWDNIEAVAAQVVARYVTAPLDITTFLRRVADHDGSGTTPANSHTIQAYHIWLTDPQAAGAWTRANFNSSEFGYRT